MPITHRDERRDVDDRRSRCCRSRRRRRSSAAARWSAAGAGMPAPAVPPTGLRSTSTKTKRGRRRGPDGEDVVEEDLAPRAERECRPPDDRRHADHDHADGDVAAALRLFDSGCLGHSRTLARPGAASARPTPRRRRSDAAVVRAHVARRAPDRRARSAAARRRDDPVTGGAISSSVDGRRAVGEDLLALAEHDRVHPQQRARRTASRPAASGRSRGCRSRGCSRCRSRSAATSAASIRPELRRALPVERRGADARRRTSGRG